jgi:serine/threonine-protein kinase
VIEPGAILGSKYRLVRLLGEGAMGAVYEAEHTAIGKRVALKVLHDRYAGSAQAVARFEREARAAAAIGHENIVDVMDFGMHDGVPFLVMELLKGQTVAERLAATTTIEPRSACRIAAQVLSALASAHAAGSVHRDLKPANVLLVERGGRSDFPKLLDFGISKFRRPDSVERVTTQDGMLLGTPDYMAPEQWMGRRDIDHRADLFAVGVMLYEMLTGGLPYEGETQGELFLEVVKSETEPPRPSEIAPTAPPALDDIVLRAVRRNVDERFQTARDFVDALRPHGAEDVSVTAEPPVIVTADESTPASSTARRARVSAATQLDATHAPVPLVIRRRPMRRAAIASAVALLVATAAVAIAKSRDSGAAVSAAVTTPRVTRAAVAPVAVVRAPVEVPSSSRPVVPPAVPEASATNDPTPIANAAPETGSSPNGHTRRIATATNRASVTTTTTAASVAPSSGGTPRAPHRHAGVGEMEVSDQF